MNRIRLILCALVCLLLISPKYQAKGLTVNAGSDQTITLPSGVTLSGTITVTPSGSATPLWSLVNGPGTVTFANPALASTSATFSSAGIYVLSLSATGAGVIGNANVTITVNASPSLPTGYYVDASVGNDSNSCMAAQTPATAKRTINAGVNCLSAGQIVYVRAGTYNEALNNNTIPSGTGYPVGATTIMAYPGDATPIMMGNVWINQKSNIIWNGVTINMVGVAPPNMDGGAEMWTGFFINSSSNILVTNSEIEYCSKNCVLTDDGNAPLSNIFITFNKIHNAGAGGWISMTEPGAHNVYIVAHMTNAPGIVVDHNESYAATLAPNNWGIQVYSTNSGFLNGVVVSNNYVHNNNQGIVVGSGPNHKVYNNVVYDNDLAASFGEAAITVGYGSVNVNNIQVYNNTIVGNNNGTGAYCIGNQFGNPTNTIIKNNICYQNGVDAINGTLLGRTGTIASNNLLGPNPLFVNAGAQNFHIQAGSPARNIGANLFSIFTTDKDGNTRPALGNWDNGAYIYKP